MGKESREKARCVGEEAERFACRYLEGRGLKLLTRNYRCAVGEIDLVMRAGEVIVFVEVRLRRDAARGNALESISLAKRRRIIRAATRYLQTHGLWDKVLCRFDVLAVDAVEGVYRAQWVAPAFDTDLPLPI